MNTKDILFVAIPVLVIFGLYQFGKAAVPGAIDALNNSPVGTVAGGVMGVINSANNYQSPAGFANQAGQWVGEGIGDALDGLGNVGD